MEAVLLTWGIVMGMWVTYELVMAYREANRNNK